MIESEEDRQAMLRDFGAEVSGPRGAFRAIFDREFIETDGIEQDAPVLTATAADAGGLRKGAILRIDGETFLVRRLEPDGTGMVRVVLEQ